MRTISYILTGRPRNRTDCIDRARQRPPRKIALERLTHETATEQFVAKVLYAAYVWVFDDMVVTYEESYGRVFQHESRQRQLLSIDNANRRLRRAIENLEERTGMTVEGRDGRFGNDLAYA